MFSAFADDSDTPPATLAPAGFLAGGSGGSALNANVLVLNEFYQAIRVVNVRRAFCMLCKEAAEVVHIETNAKGESHWQNFNLETWQELSQLKAEFEPDG